MVGELWRWDALKAMRNETESVIRRERVCATTMASPVM